MPASPNQPDPRLSDQHAESLRVALRENHETPTDAEFDRVFSGAMRSAQTTRRNRSAWRLGVSFAGIAAVLAMAFFIAQPMSTNPTPIAGDLDRNGSIDINDAFALARSLDQGKQPPAIADITGDARIDQADIDEIVRVAVRLPEKGGAS